MSFDPRGPNTKRLIAAVEKMAEKIDPSPVADALEELGRHLLLAAQMVRIDDATAFGVLTDEDLHMIETILAGRVMAMAMLNETHTLDAESN